MGPVEAYPGCERIVAQPWASERVIMVGQAPSAKGSADPRHALTGRPMRFLFEHCGLDLMRYIRAFERHNVVPNWHGYRGADAKTGSRFTWRQHAERIDWLKRRAASRRMLCWGREVAAALFGGVIARRMPLLSWEDVACSRSGALEGEARRDFRSDFRAAILPHPSGLNRWWNEQPNRDAARAFLACAVDEVHAAYRQGLTAAPPAC